jgi:hypothetical protein
LYVFGDRLDGFSAVWTPFALFAAEPGTPAEGKPATARAAIPSDAVPGIYPARIVTPGGSSEAAWVVLDDLPSVPMTGDARNRLTGQPLAVPACVEGVVDPVQPLFFRLTLKAGQRVSAEVFARRLGSSLDPVLQVVGPSGTEVAFRDDVPGLEGDCQMAFTAAADGEYGLQLRDVRYSGGPQHAFHLRVGDFPIVGSPSPRVAAAGEPVELRDETAAPIGHTFPTTLADLAGGLQPVSVKPVGAAACGLTQVLLSDASGLTETEPNDTRDSAFPIPPEALRLTGAFQQSSDRDWYAITAAAAVRVRFTARTRELGSPCDVLLELFGPDGKKMTETDDSGGRDAELSADLPAAGQYWLKVSELAGRFGLSWTYSLDINIGRPTVRITAATDHLNVPRGGTAAVPVTVEQFNLSVPLQLSIPQSPSHVSMPPVTLAPSQRDALLVLNADAVNPATGAGFGPVRVSASAADGSPVQVEFRLAPPPPRKDAAERFRSHRLRADLFAAVATPPEFVVTPQSAAINVVQGSTAAVVLTATRTDGWSQPIEVSLATPADQLPPGVTVTAGSLAESELSVSIAASADATAGPVTVFLSARSKKDKTERTWPVTPIHVQVTPAAP